ncbi:MAG: Ig-like domain-containing protein [Alphaproteobacteria bacterium]|nr:Ig-like domain-containing protein [Alphaproteobacteria bacterium]
MRTLLLVVALAGCKGPVAPIDTDPGLPPREELLGIGLAPRDPVARVGEQVPFFATAYYDNTEYEDITAQSSWISTDTRVATIGADGVALALAEGETEIVVQDGTGKSSKVKMTVIGETTTITGVSVTPASLNLHIGDTVQLSAVASYSDGSTGNLGSGCTWNTSNGAVASVDASALVSGVAAGTAMIGAACDGGLGGQATVTVVEEEVDLGQPDIAFTYADGIGIDTDVLWIVEVTNLGDAYAGGFFVDAFLDPSGTPVPGTPYDASTYVSGLAPGETAELYLEMYGAPEGTFSSWVGADFDGYVAESNESNNVSGPITIETSAALLGPDLVIVDAFALTDGFITEYLIEIENQGDQTALDFWLDLYTDQVVAPGTCAIGDRYINIDTLAPGATYVWDPIVNDAQGVTPWLSWVFVDSCDDADESDEFNNQSSFSPI